MGVYKVWLADDEGEECGITYLDRPASDDVSDRFNIGNSKKWALDARDAVKLYADYFHSQRDGWECTWPLTFRVRCPDGQVLDYEVERHTVPEFEVESDHWRERRLAKAAADAAAAERVGS